MSDGNGVNIVVGGRGGQGVLFATAILEGAAVRLGMDVIGSETHGMAQRGGSVVSHFKLGKRRSPLVASGEADILISLEKTETYRNLPFLKAGGTCFANLPEGEAFDAKIAAFLEKARIGCFTLDADALARSLDAPQATNVILIGLFASWPEAPFTREDFLGALETTGAARFRRKNREVFEAGFEAGRRAYFSEGQA
ncbi:MAG: 2-oxoacid:acceptor oxidoreductase family protein [Planctomycetota bacterium]|jgi:indolepyruvate ferredoxin oxidoreductase beta subunit